MWAGALLSGEICWVSLGPQYDNETLTELFVIDGIKTKLLTHNTHLASRAGDLQYDCGGEISNNRHQLQLLPVGLICVGGWGLGVASVSWLFPIKVVIIVELLVSRVYFNHHNQDICTPSI